MAGIQSTLAAVCAKNVAQSGTAVCVDSFGLYLSTAYGLMGNQDLFIVRKDSSGHAVRMNATRVTTANGTGLTAFLVDTPEPLPSAALPQFPIPSGALYANKITFLSPDAYRSIQNTIEVNALRGRLRWQWAESQQQAFFVRDAFLPPAPAGALFDDAGVVIGMTNVPAPPNAENVAIISSLSTIFSKPVITFLTPTATTSTLTKPRDFFFRVHGLKPQDDPTVRLSLGAFGTWRTYAAQRVPSGEFVVRAVPLATAPASRVDYKVEVLLNNSIVETRTGQVSVGGASVAAVGADNVRDLDQKRTVVLPLPGFPLFPTVGGNGRYLIFRCNVGTGTIAVLDVAAASLRTVDVDSTSRTLIPAAGADKLLVLDATRRELRRFDLQTLALEAKAVLPDDQGLQQQMVMGSGSHGPAVICCQSGVQVIDVGTLRPLAGAFPPEIHRIQYLTSNASGRLITGWAGAAGVNVFRWNGASFLASAPTTGLRPSEVFPDPDGERIYTGRGPVVLSSQATPRTADRSEPWYPAADTSEFFFGASAQPGTKTFSAVVYHAQTQKPILAVPIEELKAASPASSINRNVWLFAGCGRIVVLPPGEPKLVIHPADISGEAGNRRGLVCFTSIPPRVVRAGQTLHYQLQTVSARDDKLTFNVDHGPQGMQVSAEGEVSWAIPATAKGSSAEVVISVRDAAGVTGIHKFTIYVE